MKIGINAQLMAGARAGIGNYIYNLVNALGRVDSINQYLLFVKGMEAGSARAKNQEVIIASPVSSASWARILWEQFVLPFELKTSDVDIMHFPDYALPVFFDTKPWIITVHDLAFKLFPETFSRGKLATKLALIGPSLSKAAKIIAVSENTKKDLMDIYNVSSSRIEVIYNGVNLEIYKPLDTETVKEELGAKFNLKPGYILYVGTLEPRKNIVNVVKAFKELKDHYHIPQQLVIGGSKGWLYQEIFRSVNEYGLAGEVVFTGYVPEGDLPLLYNGAGVFVYPSLYEGFGLPPLEAMACGTPVVTSNVSSLPEVVGDAGLLVEPRDSLALADAIHRVLNNPELAAELSAKGVGRARLFTWEEAARKTLTVYEEVYAKAGKRR